MAHQKIQVRGYPANLFSFVLSAVIKRGSTPKRALHQRGLCTKDGGNPLQWPFSEQFSSHFNSTIHAHETVVFEVAKAIRTPLINFISLAILLHGADKCFYLSNLPKCGGIAATFLTATSLNPLRITPEHVCTTARTPHNRHTLRIVAILIRLKLPCQVTMADENNSRFPLKAIV